MFRGPLVRTLRPFQRVPFAGWEALVPADRCKTIHERSDVMSPCQI